MTSSLIMSEDLPSHSSGINLTRPFEGVTILFINRGDAYHLMENNCNNFTNELAQFLCGSCIPKHILDLPLEVLNT